MRADEEQKALPVCPPVPHAAQPTVSRGRRDEEGGGWWMVEEGGRRRGEEEEDAHSLTGSAVANQPGLHSPAV